MNPKQRELLFYVMGTLNGLAWAASDELCEAYNEMIERLDEIRKIDDAKGGLSNGTQGTEASSEDDA